MFLLVLLFRSVGKQRYIEPTAEKENEEEEEDDEEDQRNPSVNALQVVLFLCSFDESSLCVGERDVELIRTRIQIAKID